MMMEGGFHFRRRRTAATTWGRIKQMAYDPETLEIMGRTKQAWLRVSLFYLVFMSVLALLIATCFVGLYASINYMEPRWILDEAILKTPGVSFRPVGDQLHDGSLIYYNMNHNESVQVWVQRTNDFLKIYERPQTSSESYVRCQFGQGELEYHQACVMNMTHFGNCTRKNNYGFSEGSPCIFLKLNKVIKWKPQYYITPQIGMPKTLRYIVRHTTYPYNQQVWLSCEGESGHDKERAPYFWYSEAGFPGYYFPYKKTKNYLSPLIAVQVLKPKKNNMITIECRVWASNIDYVGGVKYRSGSVLIHLLIDTWPEVDRVNREKEEADRNLHDNKVF